MRSDSIAAIDRARVIRDSMECVVLPPRPGVVPSALPPVEIFLGTEPAQYRANRVFGWSIEKVRDPSREVRIHLLSELPGFDRRGWTTGFTNFRFAIPALQGGRGRAIYNDEDQIYLTDPGVLFDLDLGSRAHLSMSDTESSVMLIDCERMSGAWSLQEAQHTWKRALLRKATRATGLRGDLDPGWNARDEEFEPGRSHLLHYTTLHTQPWRPFPERFVYQQGAHTQLWHELEREAIVAGFEFFRREAPSRGFRDRLGALRALPRSVMGSGLDMAGEAAGAVERLARRAKARNLLEIQPDLRGDDEQRPGRFGLDSERRVGFLEWLSELGNDDRFDGVLCLDGLESLPVWDIPWIVETLFQYAERFVFVAVRTPEMAPRRRFFYPPQGTTHTVDWWRSHFESASKRHPEISWELMSTRGNSFDSDRVTFHSGGPWPDSNPPIVWTLTDGEPGNDTQVGALVGALGWPGEPLRPRMGLLSHLPFASRGAHLRGLDAQSRGRSRLQPPWPDLLVVAGRRVAPIARWVREMSRGRTRVVALGAKTATPAEEVDLAVTPRGAMLFSHPKRLETDRPLVPARPSADSWDAARWREHFRAIPGRKIALLLGSGTHRLGLDGRAADALGRLVAESATDLGAVVLISASRHTRREVFAGCLRGVGEAAFVHHETRDQRVDERAWPAILEAADIFVMAGLGETTLAQVCATGRPVFLSPQLPGGLRFWPRWRDRWIAAIVRRAHARRANDRGTTGPQEGLELICARLIDRGWVRPRRDVEALRGRLVRNGHARLLRAPIRAGDLERFAPALESEIAGVADRIRDMLGVPVEASADPLNGDER
ncbi:MAG: hypothetical protein GY910_02240 [bacterium]|nr:hypothetical protein [Deltaproteobacteria bacterium]MCP4903774.1 hypothetical protein [bacterium]